MANVCFDDVLKLAEQLPKDEQIRLIYSLRLKQQAHRPMSAGPSSAPDARPEQGASADLSRQQLLSAAAALRQRAPRSEDRLLGKYANPSNPSMSEEEFHAQIHAIATEWEQSLDHLDADES